MKLYYSPGACSLSPHIVAVEAGIPVELEKVNLAEHKTEAGQDYMQVNPKGYVPALRLDDGSVLTEGPAIVQYLADQNPASGLAPKAGTIERYRLQECLNFIGTELHKNFGPLFNKASSDEAKNMAKTNINKRLTYLNDQLTLPRLISDSCCRLSWNSPHTARYRRRPEGSGGESVSDASPAWGGCRVCPADRNACGSSAG